MYFTAVIIFIILNFFTTILVLIMAFRIKNNKLNILWPISILKYSLPFFSFIFFSQYFLLLATIFDCKDGFSYVSQTLKCRTGGWFSILGPTSGIALFLHSIISIITNFLYFKPIFIKNGSDLLKKIDPMPDIILIITKLVVNILFIFDKGTENEQWPILFILILFTGTNAYYNLCYQHRENKTLASLNNIFCLITLIAYITLFIGKIFTSLEFTGSIYLFISSILIIIIFIFIYKNNEIDYVLTDYTKINNPVDFLYYIANYYIIIQNRNKSRNYLIILKSLITKIEQNCIVFDCPLRKYIMNLKKGVECPFLLNQYCQRLFEYGISKFSNDELLKNNYSMFLITSMNYKRKALIIINNLSNKTLSFQNYFIAFRTLKLVDKWQFCHVHKNNSTFEYRRKIKEFKTLMRKLILDYYDIISLLLSTKLDNIDNFNKIHKLGLQIMKLNPRVEEIYNILMDIKIDNIQIIKIYTEFVQNILKDEEKLEKCKKNAELKFSNTVDILEKDFSNFNLGVLNKGDIPYLVISTKKENLGNIVDLSMKACTLFGYTKWELKEQNINILIPKIFQQKHDILISQQYEKHKFKFLDELNKKKVYFPNFIKKGVFGITKMRFLIELKLYIYFVKTEDNRLVYIAEIINYNPLIVDLMKNNLNNLKCCILTDENLLIQNFTPNCLENLKMNYADINSNFSIINYIKQFQEDYLNAINNISNNMIGHISNSEMFSDRKLSDKKNSRNNVPPNIKKKIKKELLMKKYSKKCKISWRIIDEMNSKKLEIAKKNFISKASQNSIKYSKSNIFKQNKTDSSADNLIDAFMEIKNIIIDNELLGYYFFLTKIKTKCINNMSYVIQKNETIGKKNNVTKLKLKKYQCKFKSEDSNNIEETKFSSDKNQLFSSIIDKSPKNSNKDIAKNAKHFIKKNFLSSFSLITDKKNLENTFKNYKFNRDNDSLVVTGEYIPEFSCQFTIITSLNNLTYIKIKEKNNTFLEQLKNEANKKIKTYQNILNFISKNSSSNESDEFESVEGTSSEKILSNSSMNNDSSNTNSNSLIENKKESIINNDSAITENKENDNFNPIKNWLKKENYEYNSDINGANNSNKSLPKRNKRNDNFYKVNLNNIIFMYYDFNKDMIVEDSNVRNESKMEKIMNDYKNQENILEKEEHLSYSYFSQLNHNNKSKKVKTINSNKPDNQNKNEKKNIPKKVNKINEEKLTKKKIYESLNNHKSEPPAIKLKIFVYIAFICMISFCILIIYLDLKYLGSIKNDLNIIKYTIFISYYSHISIYYLRELTLLNFNVSEIEGGEYVNIPSKNKKEYINLIKDQLSKLFIENQKAMKILYSTSSLSLNKKSIKILDEYSVVVKMSNYKKINMNYDILTALMQYSGAFYNFVSSTTPIAQNHSDVYNYIYNNLNGYKEGINVLIDIVSNELELLKKEILYVFLILEFVIFIIFIILYINTILNFLSAIKLRGNYMKVFYGINEFILKKTISNCENLLNKLKSFEDLNNHDEGLFYENIDDKFTFEKNQITIHKEKSLGEYNNLNDGYENRKEKLNSLSGISFVILYGVFILMFYIFYIYNGMSIFNESQKSITRNDYCNKILNTHLIIIDTFNVYREFLFDNLSMIYGTTPFEYLNEATKKGLSIFSQNNKYLKKYENTLTKNIEEITNNKSLCNYYINDFYDSYIECEEGIGLISKYNFITLSIYFLEELKIKKNIIEYKLEKENILGNLTEYNYSDYINNEKIPRKGDYNNTNKTNTQIFRLDLFNNKTLHYELNIIYFNIILPFIEENLENFYSILSFEKVEFKLLSLNCLFLIIILLLFFCYFLPGINIIYNIIYKTKNMLSIIPFSLLSYQSNVLILLKIANNK